MTRGLKPYTPMAMVLRSPTGIASDVEGLRLVLATTIADRYEFEVPDNGSEGPGCGAGHDGVNRRR